MPSNERRQDQRVRLSLRAEWVRKGSVDTVEIVEASYRGLFMAMSAVPFLNELIKLRVELPTGNIYIHVVPVRQTLYDGRRGVGCRIFALSGTEKTEWQRYINSALRTSVRAA